VPVDSGAGIQSESIYKQLFYKAIAHYSINFYFRAAKLTFPSQLLVVLRQLSIQQCRENAMRGQGSKSSP
jgi:hypothetical protein